MLTKFFGKPKGGDHLADPDSDERIINKRYVKEIGCKGVNWTNPTQDGGD